MSELTSTLCKHRTCLNWVVGRENKVYCTRRCKTIEHIMWRRVEKGVYTDTGLGQPTVQLLRITARCYIIQTQ